MKTLPDLRNCKICIIGLGYVGLPLAVEFASKKICLSSGLSLNRVVYGFDTNELRLSQLDLVMILLMRCLMSNYQTPIPYFLRVP